MNQFQYLTGPCLVCKRQRRGIAWGITPNQAICDDCYVDKPDESAAALDKAVAVMDKERAQRERARKKAQEKALEKD